MSQIATALAKAKERPVTQAPFMVSGTAVQAKKPAKKRVSANMIWGGVLVFSMSSAGALIWWNQASDKSAAPVTVEARPDDIPAYYSNNTTTANGTTLPLPATPQLSPAAMQARITRNENAVRQLNISAVIPGEQPKIMANGRIYQIGDIVIQPEISFSGTVDGQLVFTDPSGNRFTRRF